MDVKSFTARFATVALAAAISDAALTLFLIQAGKDPLVARGNNVDVTDRKQGGRDRAAHRQSFPQQRRGEGLA